MGSRINDWAWKQDLPMGEKTVLLCLAQHAKDTTAECFPGVERIAAESGCSEKSVRRYRKGLEDRELIEILLQAGRVSSKVEAATRRGGTADAGPSLAGQV